MRVWRGEALLPGVEPRVFCVNHEAGPTIVEQDGAVEVTRFGRWGRAGKFDVCPDFARALSAFRPTCSTCRLPTPSCRWPSCGASESPRRRHVSNRLDPSAALGGSSSPWNTSCIAGTSAILATSPTYPHGSEFLRPFAEKIEVLPMGLDLAPYADPSAEDRAEAERIKGRHAGPIWLCCGRMNYYKGFLTAVPPWRTCRERSSSSATDRSVSHRGGDRPTRPGERVACSGRCRI